MITVLVIGIVIVVVIGIYAVRTGLVAEENLQAFFHAHRATLEYVQQNDGQWPKSWDDLRSTLPESDFEWAAEHVAFDFDADPLKIAAQTPDTFTAIVPEKPCYIVDDRVQLLIDVLKRHHGIGDTATEETDETEPK